MTVKSARQALATAMTGVTANVYSYVPAQVMTPAIIIVPGEPYLSLEAIGSKTRIRARFEITAAVAAMDIQAALDNIETLCENIFSHLPQGAIVDSFTRPTMTQIGPSDLLTTGLTVEVITG